MARPATHSAYVEPPAGAIADALRRGSGALRAAGIEDPALEAELLLRHVLGWDKTTFFARLQDTLPPEQRDAFLGLLRQRLAHKPSAYITGRREFYGLDLHVAPGVLIPRPETEHVVEHCLRLGRALCAAERRATFVDVGTGSGAIALAVARHLPQIEALATDSSPAALAIAAYNAKRLRLAGRVRFLHGNLLEPVPGPLDLIAANLPYVPTAVCESLAPEVREHEPRAALDGGTDGLDLIRRLLGQAAGRLRAGGAIVLEIGHDQAEPLRVLLEGIPGASGEVYPDLAGHDRVAVVTL